MDIEKLLNDENVDEIVAVLKNASDEYYNNNNSIISDEEFDIIKDRLRDIDPENSFLEQIGATPNSDTWVKRKHKIPMASLNKCNTSSEFLAWAKSINASSYMTEDKADGISIDLEYSFGKLVAATTRGNGLIGQNILDNVIKMKNVKVQLDIPFNGNIRGEVVITKSDFIELLKLEPSMKNRRNAAGGIAVRSSGEHAEYLSVFCYDVIDRNVTFEHEHDKMFKIVQIGLVPTSYTLCKSVEDVINVMNSHIDSLRDGKNYDIDGLVVKVNDLKLQNGLGLMTNGNPKGQVAWKFPNQLSKTELVDIEWSIGKGGAITPVAIFKPVFVAGAMLAKASLGSYGEFIRMRLRKGDIIEISRRNDVIPKVERVLIQSENPIILPPTSCPNCDNGIEFSDKKAWCPNKSCTARFIGDITTWVKALDIKGLGPALLEALFENGEVKTPVDFYTNSFLQNSVMSNKVTNKIVTQLQEKKELTLDIFIDALNIEGVGGSTTRMLMKSGYDTLDKLYELRRSEISYINGLGDIKADMIIDGLLEKKAVINELFNVGITIVKPQKVVVSNNTSSIAGKSILFTGTMSHGRKEMTQEALLNGLIVAERVSKDLDFLVVPDIAWTSSKTQKAQKLNIKIITENDYENLLKSI